jgi:hypothetical protein
VLRYLGPDLGPGEVQLFFHHQVSPSSALISVPPNIKTPSGSQLSDIRRLFASQLAALHHGSVLFLESLVQALGTLEVLVDAAHDALLFTVDQGLGGEIVDAVIEAALDHLGIHLEGDIRSEI